MYSKRLLVVVCFVVLSLVTLLTFLSFRSEKNARLQKEKELQSVRSELSGKDAQIAQIKKQQQEVERALNEKIAFLGELVKSLQDKNDKLESVLKNQDESFNSLSQKNAVLEKDKTALMEDNLAKSQEVTDLEKKMAGVEAARTELLAKLKDFESKKTESSGSQKSSRVVSGLRYDSPPTADAAKIGKVIVQKSTGRSAQVQHVNDIYQFVILSAGSREGLHRGSVINIVRGDQIIAKATVEKIKQDVSAAILLPDWTLETPKVGDFVTQF